MTYAPTNGGRTGGNSVGERSGGTGKLLNAVSHSANLRASRQILWAAINRSLKRSRSWACCFIDPCASGRNTDRRGSAGLDNKSRFSRRDFVIRYDRLMFCNLSNSRSSSSSLPCIPGRGANLYLTGMPGSLSWAK